MQASPACLKLITDHEGLSLTPYKDVGGRWTVGYGHLIKAPWAAAIPRDISLAEAMNLLEADLDETVQQVNLALFDVSTTQPEFDALVSLVFNIGIEAFKSSTMLRLLKARDVAGAAEQFLVWDHCEGQVVPGLLKRRQAERELFLSPVETVA